MNSSDQTLSNSLKKSAKSGSKKDLFNFKSVSTLMGHTVPSQKSNAILMWIPLPENCA